MEEPLRQFGILDVSGVVLLWVGSYDSEDGSGIKSVEIEARGRHSGIEMGTAKPGEDSNQKMTSQLSYYKVTVNNEVIIEIDFINMIEKIGGVDRLEQHRRNLLIN
jgi:P2 family phage contractile tail tube protein